MQLPNELEAGHYDLVTALALLEHLPDTGACMREAFRMLKPGGVFVAPCPNPFWNDLARTFKLVEDDFHELAVNRDLLLNLATEAGFVQATYRPFMWVVVGALPYLGLNVNPGSSLLLDKFIQRIPGTDFSFVNQALIAQKSP
jgi:ubiquinone/menaquinone biosynthesis C-methylase UbiE